MFMLPFAPSRGGGLAKGLGGPVAPAERSAGPEGDGGGRTCMGGRCVCAGCSVPRGEAEGTVALPPFSELSSGICTLSRGRGGILPDFRLSDLGGGVNVVSGIETRGIGLGICELARCDSGGDLAASPFRVTLETSIDCERLFGSFFIRDSVLIRSGSAAKDARCCERMDLFSSMGVKMLCCLRCGCRLMASEVFSRGTRGRSGGGAALGSTGAGGCGSCGGGWGCGSCCCCCCWGGGGDMCAGGACGGSSCGSVRGEGSAWDTGGR